jgi:choline dehydrogenase-like flavoprotein
MKDYDFIIVGSGGGGGTIAWLLAKAGLKVALLEQGRDIYKEELPAAGPAFNARVHDEYRFRLRTPDPKRRLRGDYNTFRKTDKTRAEPFGEMGGWTSSVLGGGSVTWGTWAFRALPVDLRLRTHFENHHLGQSLRDWGYAVEDWPIGYQELEPYYDVAEALFAVTGDREAMWHSIVKSNWYRDLGMGAPDWRKPAQPYPLPPYPRTPVGEIIFQSMDSAKMNPCQLPTAIVNPGSEPYATREKVAAALAQWDPKLKKGIWGRPADELWSERVRQACNMCGFCGEYLCWGKLGPKSGTHVTTIEEIRDLADVRCHAKVFEITTDKKNTKATGVRYLDLTDRDKPKLEILSAKNVIVSCGAVQSARLLLLSKIGNRAQIGRNVTFHLFGMESQAVFPSRFAGLLRHEFGHTGNVTSFSHYFVQDPVERRFWYKAGVLTSTANKNPLEKAVQGFRKAPRLGEELLKNLERHCRTVKVRITGDDLPMPANRVDLDDRYVDEYGIPVARITRSLGEHEKRLYAAMEPVMKGVFQKFVEEGILYKSDITASDATINLVGDHQMGTCRMGEDPKNSVVDPECRLHGVPNVYVVDSSFMPTGLGLNPMLTVVANALRVGTHIVKGG